MLRFLAMECLLLAVGCGYPALPPVDDPAVGCNMSSQCTNMDSPVCDTTMNGGTCVQCTVADHQACAGYTPRCAGDKCAACVDDTMDCGAGGLCLLSGACAGPSNIVHVKSGGSSADGCGDTSNSCTLGKALAIVMTTLGKTVIKIDDAGTYTPPTNNFSVDADVAIDMRAGAILHPAMDGPVLEVKNNRTVAILGGTIEGATGSNGDGILCNDKVKLTVVGTIIKTTDKSAINMLAGCNLTITQATITDTSRRANTFVAGIFDSGDSIVMSRSSLTANRGGGITIISGTFILVGNAFLNNGTDNTSVTGGISISTASSSTNRLDFNTVTKSVVQDGNGSAISCNAGTLTGRNNIFWDNKPVTIGVSTTQISGGCKYSFSDIGPAPTIVLSINDGGHNLLQDPMLVNELTDPHLKVGSPAIGNADPGSDLTGVTALDIDGDMRVKRTTANMGADIGADQYKP